MPLFDWTSADYSQQNNDFHILNTYLLSEILSLEQLISSRSYQGYDPHDVKGSRLFIKALSIPRKPFISNCARKFFLGPLVYLELFFPRFLRVLFRVKPQLNFKGLGLIAQSYFLLYKNTGDKHWLLKGESLIDLLISHRSLDSSHLCWGYPFDWDSGIFVPKYTPTSVVSVAVFDACWDAYLATNNTKYIDYCHSICRFFVNDLNISHITSELLCFSYTPLDHFKVHNINLLVAHCLLRLGTLLNIKSYIKIATKAVNFTLSQQNSNGSIYYWSHDQDNLHPCEIDNYHSGFEIRALFGISKLLKHDYIDSAWRKYYHFYSSYLLFHSEGRSFPKLNPSSIYPIDIHSCAESIYLTSVLLHTDVGDIQQLISLINEIIAKMKLHSGFYKYCIYKHGPILRSSNIVYMRWGQAWMFLALTQALDSVSTISHK